MVGRLQQTTGFDTSSVKCGQNHLSKSWKSGRWAECSVLRRSWPCGERGVRFAHLKRHLNFRRLRLRGMTGALDECTLAAVAQVLRKLVKLIGFSPPPMFAACMS
jgi:hypothetical protein